MQLHMPESIDLISSFKSSTIQKRGIQLSNHGESNGQAHLQNQEGWITLNIPEQSDPAFKEDSS